MHVRKVIEEELRMRIDQYQDRIPGGRDGLETYIANTLTKNNEFLDNWCG